MRGALSKGKIPTGLIFAGDVKSLEENTLTSKEPMALQNISLDVNLQKYEELLKDFR